MFTRGEVSAHNSVETGIWVTYGDGVYDISEFVSIHPGGERILLAAGQAIDPFWAVFSIHGTPETRELLETYRIGDLLPRKEDPTADAAAAGATSGIEKLFANEPERHDSLRVLSARPCNAEAAPDSLLSFVTPNDRFFVRNHLPVPVVDPATYRLQLEGPGIPEDFSISLDELKRLPRTDVMVTLQCAGNRRKEMTANQPKPIKGLQWEGGAISNTVWSGVRLRDVLAAAGYTLPDLASTEPLPGGVAHVVFDGIEGYGASIPIEKAIDPRGDVLLAYEMNGEPIPRDHGFPVRAVVPGHVAARSVKWLGKISLSDDESPSHWQQRDYKGFSPSATLETSDYSTAKSIQELPVQSAILSPQPGATLVPDASGLATIKGYAVSGGGRGINRVDVSIDGGKSWIDAELVQTPNQPYGRQWAWTHWEARIPASQLATAAKNSPTGEIKLVCKAVDSSYNSQPETFDGIYNVRGVLVGAWQRIPAKVQLDPSSSNLSAAPASPPAPAPAPAISVRS
eukprot:jgi/Hompol1/356/HPOL_003107-RA